jgi:hypothetical protein
VVGFSRRHGTTSAVSAERANPCGGGGTASCVATTAPQSEGDPRKTEQPRAVASRRLWTTLEPFVDKERRFFERPPTVGRTMGNGGWSDDPYEVELFFDEYGTWMRADINRELA